jgi:hypothetical protein
VSNPVAPPPPAGDGFPPPAQGQPHGAVPAQGPPPGDPAQQGFGPAPEQGFGPAPEQGVGPAPEPKKKSAFGRIALRIVGAIVVFVVILVAKDFLFGDKAKDAAVGDCIASSQDVKVDETTEAEAKVVDCTSGDAAFTVVGRVDGETDTKSKSCEKFFKENEEYYVYSSEAKGGYLLCLRPKAA